MPMPNAQNLVTINDLASFINHDQTVGITIQTDARISAVLPPHQPTFLDEPPHMNH